MSELGKVTRCYTLTYERRSRHPVSRVWRSISDPEEVSRWMRYPARIDLRRGGDYFVDFGSSPDGGALDGVIVRIEAERSLAVVWGLSVLEWQLEPDGEGCRYTFVHHGQAPRLVPDDEGLAAGWHLFLDALAASLDDPGPLPPEDETEHRVLMAPYRERLDAVLG